jgi:hypothetical protein
MLGTISEEVKVICLFNYSQRTLVATFEVSGKSKKNNARCVIFLESDINKNNCFRKNRLLLSFVL